MSGAVIAIRGLSKAYGALKVSDDVSLDVTAGEIHALIGPNGAGKTTLVHQISGMTLPDSGAIMFQGRNITRLSPQGRARLGLARTFQINSVIASLPVLENVALAVQAHAPQSLHPFRLARDDETLNRPARQALAAVGLSERAQAPAGSLSHGEKRALEIAMALALAPAAILFDEPMAGVSREESAKLVALLKNLKGRFAMLLIEHDMDAVFSLADRVSVLVAGRIIASGPPAAVRSDPQVRAAYLGDES